MARILRGIHPLRHQKEGRDERFLGRARCHLRQGHCPGAHPVLELPADPGLRFGARVAVIHGEREVVAHEGGPRPAVGSRGEHRPHPDLLRDQDLQVAGPDLLPLRPVGAEISVDERPPPHDPDPDAVGGGEAVVIPVEIGAAASGVGVADDVVSHQPPPRAVLTPSVVADVETFLLAGDDGIGGPHREPELRVVGLVRPARDAGREGEVRGAGPESGEGSLELRVVAVASGTGEDVGAVRKRPAVTRLLRRSSQNEGFQLRGDGDDDAGGGHQWKKEREGGEAQRLYLTDTPAPARCCAGNRRGTRTRGERRAMAPGLRRGNAGKTGGPRHAPGSTTSLTLSELCPDQAGWTSGSRRRCPGLSVGGLRSGQAGHQLFGTGVKGLRDGRPPGREEGDRLASVAAPAGFGVDGHLGEEGLEALGLADAAAIAEEVVAGAVVALEPGHVLDQAEDRDVDLGEHRDGLAGVDEGDFLRGGDDDRAIDARRSGRW